MKRPHEQAVADSVDDARLRPHLRERARSERRDLVVAQSRVLREAIASSDHAFRPGGLPSRQHGDPRDLRGIPVVARSVAGASPGTQPEQATIRRAERAAA